MLIATALEKWSQKRLPREVTNKECNEGIGIPDEYWTFCNV